MRLLLLTGCRRSEVLTLRWSDYREGRLFLRDSKTGPRTVWLSGAAREILDRVVRTGAWVLMPINGKVRCIDHCIHHIVAALNAGGVRTTACCCGHGTMNGNIILEDGRVLLLLPSTPSNMDEWGKVVVR